MKFEGLIFVIKIYKSEIMKNLMLIALLLNFTNESFAQNIDLSTDPNKRVINRDKTNAQLLSEVKTGASSDTTISNVQIEMPVINSKNSSMFLDENGQRVHTQSQEINMGNRVKAINTIHYDNSGKVKGSGTSINLGGKDSK